MTEKIDEMLVTFMQSHSEHIVHVLSERNDTKRTEKKLNKHDERVFNA